MKVSYAVVVRRSAPSPQRLQVLGSVARALRPECTGQAEALKPWPTTWARKESPISKA